MSRPRPLTILLAFLATLPVAMLFAAIASPWVQAALEPLRVFPLHRVFSRLTMLGVIAGAIWLLIRFRLAQREVLGFQLPAARFFRHALVGLLAGALLMGIALLPLFALDLREWDAARLDRAGGWAAVLARSLGSGLLVALIEETFFRGALQGALTRQGAPRMALFAVPAFYAAVHFLGRAASVPHENVTALSGFVALRGFFSEYAAPLRILDAFVALYFVGLLLALVRRRWGGIAGCIGLHAGFVAVIATLRRVSVGGPNESWSFLVGRFDGLLGVWIAALTALCCLLLWRRSPRAG